MGVTRRGKGCKAMAIADRAGLPVAVHVASAAPHEVTLVRPLLRARLTAALPERLIGDRADGSDAPDAELAARGLELIAPHRRHRTKPEARDGRPLRRYKRRCRWTVERLDAWLQNYRRVLVRQEYHLA